MSDIFYLWLFTRADAIQGFFQFLMIVGGMLSAILLIVKLGTVATYADPPLKLTLEEIYEKPFYKGTKRWAIFAVILFLVGGLFYMLVPGKRDVAIIVGGHLIVEAVKSPIVQDTAMKLNELIQGELDSALDDLRKKKEARDTRK